MAYGESNGYVTDGVDPERSDSWPQYA